MRYLILFGAFLLSVFPARAAEPAGLKSVPADAIIFAHADVRKLWNSEWGTAVRKAFPPSVVGEIKLWKGAGIDFGELETATFYVPAQSLFSSVVILRSRTAFDAAKIGALDEQWPERDGRTGIFLRDEKTCIFASKGLVDDLKKGVVAKPGDASMAPYIEMAAGKPLTVAVNVAATLDSLPPVVRQALPELMESYAGLLDAKMACVQLDAGKGLTVDFTGTAENAGNAGSYKRGLDAVLAFARGGIRRAADSEEKWAEPFKPSLPTVTKSFADLEFKREMKVIRGSLTIPGDFEVGTPVAEAIKQVLAASYHAKSANNLKQIVLALQQFSDAYGALPGAAICDKKGKPLLSWRVAILPYVEQDALYKEFELDEPWDSEHNKKLIPMMPEIYLLENQKNDGRTHLRLFQGNGALFEMAKPTPFAGVMDGLSNTAMLFPIAEAVEWTKPDELQYDPKKDVKKQILFKDGRANLLLADGTVRTISEKVTSATFHKLITKNGGEVIDLKELDR